MNNHNKILEELKNLHREILDFIESNPKIHTEKLKKLLNMIEHYYKHGDTPDK